MDFLQQYQIKAWCKPNWCFPSMNKETYELLDQCADSPKVEVPNDLEEIINKSNQFPIEFPIDTVRLKELKERRPLERLKHNITSTYPLIHERVLLLMTHFLLHKRQYGSTIEKTLYQDMTVTELIDRILKKRAVSFMGPKDKYKLLSSETGRDGWEAVGTPQQTPPLVLEDCLSYDEMKLSAMVYVSGHTECINDGTRRNVGVVQEDAIEDNAVIIGLIGPRFKRVGRMDYEDIVISESQNRLENGFGEESTSTMKTKQSERRMWRQLWAQFYQPTPIGDSVNPKCGLESGDTDEVPLAELPKRAKMSVSAGKQQVHSYTFEELKSNVDIKDQSEENRYTNRFVKIVTPKSKRGKGKGMGQEEIFDNEAYNKRLVVIIESTLIEAEFRAKECGKYAFINVVGCGLGVWKISPHQLDVYILSFLERIQVFLKKDLLNHVSDINFAYIKPSKGVMALFNNTKKKSEKKIFFGHKSHPRGGINIQLESREPSSKLSGEHEGKLLVLTYPWDGNAHPGNEFWLGSLKSSGDPAAACSTQVSELHNAHINPAVSTRNVRVAGRHGLCALADYCARVPSETRG